MAERRMPEDGGKKRPGVPKGRVGPRDHSASASRPRQRRPSDVMQDEALEMIGSPMKRTGQKVVTSVTHHPACQQFALKSQATAVVIYPEQHATIRRSTNAPQPPDDENGPPSGQKQPQHDQKHTQPGATGDKNKPTKPPAKESSPEAATGHSTGHTGAQAHGSTGHKAATPKAKSTGKPRSQKVLTPLVNLKKK